MDQIAEFLIERETITGKEFMEIFRRVKGIQAPEQEPTPAPEQEQTPAPEQTPEQEQTSAPEQTPAQEQAPMQQQAPMQGESSDGDRQMQQ